MFSHFLHTPVSQLTSQELAAILGYAKSIGHSSVLMTFYKDSVDGYDYISKLWSLRTGEPKLLSASREHGILIGVDFNVNAALGHLWASAGHFDDDISPRPFAKAQPFVDQVLRGE